MKKIIVFASSLGAVLSLATPAFATGGLGSICPQGAFGNLCGNSQNAFGSTISSFLTLIFVVSAIIALVFLVLGGIRWITSQGDAKNVGSARDQIINSLIGLGVVFISYILINVILYFFTGGSLSQVNIPTFNAQ